MPTRKSSPAIYISWPVPRGKTPKACISTNGSNRICSRSWEFDSLGGRSSSSEIKHQLPRSLAPEETLLASLAPRLDQIDVSKNALPRFHKSLPNLQFLFGPYNHTGARSNP